VSGRSRTALQGIGSIGQGFQFGDDPVEFFDDGAFAREVVYDGAVVPERAFFFAVEPRPEVFAE
jgi:hypothetical protein